jgi:hypothetical protein
VRILFGGTLGRAGTVDDVNAWPDHALELCQFILQGPAQGVGRYQDVGKAVRQGAGVQEAVDDEKISQVSLDRLFCG